MNDIDDIIFLNNKPVITEERIKMTTRTTKTKQKQINAVGLDVGTGWICGAYSKTKTKIEYTPLRSCFYQIPLDMFSSSMFNLNSMKYVKQNDNVYIIGEDALTMAKIQNSKSLRPLSKGTVNPNEKGSAMVLKEMLRYCIESGKPAQGSNVVFSVPANVVGEGDSFNVEYHSMSISSLIESLGYKAHPLNEAYAVIVSELEKSTEVTGLGFSFGAGLVNVAFVYKGMLLFEFSINKSGDFIDQESSRATGTSESMINHIKEKQLDLLNTSDNVTPEERALLFTHTHVIKNTINQMIKAFTETNNVNIIDPVPIIISGGTTLPNGFIDIFKKELDNKNLPFEYTKIISAKDRLTAVSKGCLIMANSMNV